MAPAFSPAQRRISSSQEDFIDTVGILCEKTLSILFFDTAGTKKRTKRNADMSISFVATSDEGCAPSTCASF